MFPDAYLFGRIEKNRFDEPFEIHLLEQGTDLRYILMSKKAIYKINEI
jgi:hypothetical protein